MAKSRIRAPYDMLCKAIGHPAHKAKPNERVSWDVDVDGARCRVFAHPDDKPIALGAGATIFDSPYAIFHVEADDDEKLAWACARIAERVIAHATKAHGARTLSADDKAALNRLLHQGVPFAQAMKQIELKSDDQPARALYAWPMKDMHVFQSATTLETAVALATPPTTTTPATAPQTPAPQTTAPQTTAPQTTAPQTTAPSPASAPKTPKASATSMPSPGLALPAELPRAVLRAPYAKLAALLGEPEDKPVPFVSTRWRFVLDDQRPNPVVRWEDEPSDDPRDVDAAVFDRIQRFDAPYAAREQPASDWIVTSSSQEHLDRVLTWLEERLR